MAFQSEVLIFATFDTFPMLVFEYLKSCSQWLSLHVPTIHSRFYDINPAAQHETHFQCVTDFLRFFLQIRTFFSCILPSHSRRSSAHFSLCIHKSFFLCFSFANTNKQLYDTITCLVQWNTERCERKKNGPHVICTKWECGVFVLREIPGFKHSKALLKDNQRQYCFRTVYEPT